MACIGFENVKLVWETCPPELLWIIFKNLDYSSLYNCMTVNRRWKDVAVDYIELYGLWPNIVTEGLVDKGATFKRKSRLDWKDMVINSLLWSSVKSAQVEHRRTCKVKYSKKIHLYKDLLIVKTKKYVEFFDFNFDAVRPTKSTRGGIYWTENDFMIICLEQNRKPKLPTELQTYELQLCGKTVAANCRFFVRTQTDIILHRLEDDICYIVTEKNVVWAYIWVEDNWNQELRGRYYGNNSDYIQAIHVFNNEIYMVTKHGKILREDTASKSFKLILSHSNNKIATNWVMYNNTDVAASVPGKGGERISREIISNHMKLECRHMSCATEHGDMLFLGFKDGVVAICRPSNMRLDSCEPELYLNVKDYAENIKNAMVLSIEIFEEKMCHHLFIAIPQHIVYLILTYPLNITSYYE